MQRAAKLFTTVTGILIAQVAAAQTDPIVAFKDGTEVARAASGAPIIIPVGQLGNQNIFVQIVDETGTAAADLGPVTITGTVAGGASGELRVLIGDQIRNPPVADFNADATLAVIESVRNVGTSGGGLNIPNEELRNRSRLVVACTGDVVGDIEVGQIWRLQALGRPENGMLVGGSILGTVTARRGDGGGSDNLFTGIGRAAIEEVAVASTIPGTLQATRDSFSTDPAFPERAITGSIRRVIVGANNGGDGHGITGTIRATHGYIVSVWSTRTIGTPPNGTTPAVPAHIEAGQDIYEVRTIDESAPSAPEPRHAWLDLRAGMDFPAATPANSTSQGVLALLEVGGDLAGSICVTNIFNVYGEASTHRDANQHGGIIVRGDITASITAEIGLNNADIIGRSVLGPVRIGQRMKGSIVAVGIPTATEPDRGLIDDVEIGYPLEGVNARDNGFADGFAGNNCGPMDLFINPLDPHTPWYELGRIAPNSLACPDGGTFDSAINGARIRRLKIKRMHQLVAGETTFKAFKPRIESPIIDSLSVEFMETGVVLSGAVNHDAFGNVEDLIEDNYAVIGELDVPCVGPAADLWFKGCPKPSLGTIARRTAPPAPRFQ